MYCKTERNASLWAAVNKWNESGFRPPLCTYRLNWARRASWGWWDDWDDTVIQTQESEFEPWRSEAEHLSVTEAPGNTDFHTWMGKKHFCFFQTAETGNQTPNSGVKGSGASHYPRAPAGDTMYGVLLPQNTNQILLSYEQGLSFLAFQPLTQVIAMDSSVWTY